MPRKLDQSRAVFNRSKVLTVIAAGCLVPGWKSSVAEPTPTLDCSVDPNIRNEIVIRWHDVKAADLQRADAWTLYSHSGIRRTFDKIVVTDTNKVDKPAPAIYLSLVSDLQPDIDKINGIVVTSTAVLQVTCSVPRPTTGPSPKSPEFKAATGKADSDIYLNGSYTATVGGAPTYSVDSFAGYMRGIGPAGEFVGKLGLYGQVTTKSGSSSPTPNSYLTYAVFQRVLASEGGWMGPFQTPILNLRLIGGEFAQQGNNTNVVVSPVVVFPLRLSGGSLGPLRPGLTIPHMTFTAGVEIVKSVSSALPTANWLTRGLLGSTFSIGYAPQKPWLSSILYTAAYQVRIPSSAEVYYNSSFALVNPTTGVRGTTPPRLGTQARSYVDTKLTYNLTKFAGLTCEYTYGSLPPAFVLTHSTFALGITFTLQQTSYGRYSILKP
jgi:hypothetical protein